LDDDTKEKILERAEERNNQRPDDETVITDVEEELKNEEINLEKIESRKPKLLEISKNAEPELKERVVVVLNKIEELAETEELKNEEREILDKMKPIAAKFIALNDEL
jgi:hypothetical protein